MLKIPKTMIRNQRLRYIFPALMIALLSALFPACSQDDPDLPAVLFLCPHNASKSVMAAAHFQRLADERGLEMNAVTAGTHPGERIDPRVINLLRENGVLVEDQVPRSVTPDQMNGAYRVISLGCDPADLPPSETPIVHWDDVPPPSQDLQAAHDDIVRRVEALVGELDQR